MKSRRKAREAALQALYQCDTLGEWTEDALARFWAAFYPEALGTFAPEAESAPSEPVSSSGSESENRAFASSLMRGVLKELLQLDHLVSSASTHWSLPRMSRVDRNILRLATYELKFLPEIPASVVINEAIEIAKQFGSDESPMFINGVLDNIAKALGAQRREPPKSAAND